MKYCSVGLIKQNAALWPLFWELGRCAPFFLPHGKSYYGFRHFSKPSGGLSLDIHALASTDLEYLKASVARDFGEQRAARAIYRTRHITTMPLDDLGINPDLIKIDVEGYELATLRGLERTMTGSRPVILVGTPSCFPKYSSLFIEHNYRLFIYDCETNTFNHFDEDQERRSGLTSPLQVNVFCVAGERPMSRHA